MRTVWVATPVLALSLAAVSAPSVRAIRFEEIAVKAGLRFELRNAAAGRFRQVELMPGGVAALDFNNDGCTDIFFTNGAALPSMRKTGPEYYNRLYRNNCNLTFTDVTASAGVAGAGYSMAAAAADYDNDGHTDLFVAGLNHNILYHNRGDGTFEDVTAKAGMTGVDPRRGKMWAVSAAWLDYDNDGRLDLFVSNYVVWDPRGERACGPPDHRLYCHPDNYGGLPDQLFHNNGDGTFTDVSEKSGIARSIGKGMGVSIADYDQDGFADVFVANDSMRNFLFHNNRDGTFTETGLMAGVALPDQGNAVAGMGTDFRDCDDDGLPDVALTGMINDTYLLFRNLGPKLGFEDYTLASGLARATAQLTGWGMGMYDFDNDGEKDLFFANSHFPQLKRYLGEDSALPNTLLRNVGGGKFVDVSRQAGAAFQQPELYRGAAFADFDGDGRMDVVVTALNGPARLYRNVTADAGHWLALKLEGRGSNRDGIGARVRVTLPGGRSLYNHATTAVGYASSSERLVRFGLGAESTAPRIEIRWPGGAVQVLANVAGDRVLEVKEPESSRGSR